MQTSIKRLFKHSAIYAIGSAIQGVAGLLLIPIYTKNLPIAEYGAYELINTITLILLNILSLGLASALIKTNERDAKTKEDKKKIAGATLSLTFLFATPITIALLLSVPFLSNILGIENQNYLYIAFSSIYIILFSGIGFSILRAGEKSTLFTTFNIIRFALLLGINASFVLIFELGVFGIFLGILTAQSITLLLTIPTLIKNSTLNLEKKYIKPLLSFGIAIIPAGLSLWIMDLIDRYFINHFHGLEEVGIYSLMYKFGTGISIVLVAPFQLAWPTYSFSIADTRGAKKTYAKTLTYFLTTAGTMSLFLTIFSDEIIRLIANENYLVGKNLILPITFSYVFLGIHYIVVTGLHIAKKSHLYPLLIAIPALINIGLNWILVPRYNILGAAITTIISFAAMALLTIILTHKYFKFQYEIKRITKLGIALAIPFILFFTFSANQPIVYKVITYILLPVLLHIFRFFTKEEAKYIYKIFFPFLKKR